MQSRLEYISVQSEQIVASSLCAIAHCREYNFSAGDELPSATTVLNEIERKSPAAKSRVASLKSQHSPLDASVSRSSSGRARSTSGSF